MASFVVGLVATAASGVTLWWFMPTNGVASRYMTMPFVQTLVPIGITSGFAIGVTLMLRGILS